jgi:hypothetical protein
VGNVHNFQAENAGGRSPLEVTCLVEMMRISFVNVFVAFENMLRDKEGEIPIGIGFQP